MRLHEKLAALRKRAGLSQTDLAEQVDTTRQAVSKWETGAAAPSMENLRTLCRIYQVTMDQLTDDGQDLTEPEEATPAEEIPAEETAPEEESKPEPVRRDRKWHWIAAVAAAAEAIPFGCIITMTRPAAVPCSSTPMGCSGERPGQPVKTSPPDPAHGSTMTVRRERPSASPCRAGTAAE